MRGTEREREGKRKRRRERERERERDREREKIRERERERKRERAKARDRERVRERERERERDGGSIRHSLTNNTHIHTHLLQHTATKGRTEGLPVALLPHTNYYPLTKVQIQYSLDRNSIQYWLVLKYIVEGVREIIHFDECSLKGCCWVLQGVAGCCRAL